MRVPIDQDKFAEAGLWFDQGERDGVFHLLDNQTGDPVEHWECRAAVEGGQIVFCPHRSASQRKVIEMLSEVMGL